MAEALEVASPQKILLRHLFEDLLGGVLEGSGVLGV